jgi:hypothetical protein
VHADTASNAIGYESIAETVCGRVNILFYFIGGANRYLKSMEKKKPPPPPPSPPREALDASSASQDEGATGAIVDKAEMRRRVRALAAKEKAKTKTKDKSTPKENKTKSKEKSKEKSEEESKDELEEKTEKADGKEKRKEKGEITPKSPKSRKKSEKSAKKGAEDVKTDEPSADPFDFDASLERKKSNKKAGQDKLRRREAEERKVRKIRARCSLKGA